MMLEKKPNILLVIAGLLVPGGAHFLLGYHARAALFLVLITAMFLIGAFYGGLFYTREGNLGLIQTLSATGNVLLYLIGIFLKSPSTPAIMERAAVSPLYEYAGAFVAWSGLLNYLLVVNAVDLNEEKGV